MIKLPPLPKLPTLSKKERALAAASLAVVVVVALDHMVIRPWGHHVATLRHEIRLHERLLSNQRRLIRAGAVVDAEVARHRALLKTGAERDLQMATLFKEIETFAGQSQVSVESVKPLPVAEDDLQQVYALEVLGDGLLPQWIRFVHLIETSPWLFEIQRAVFETREGSAGVLQGSLRVSAVVLRRSPPSAAQPPPPSDAQSG